MIEKPTKEAGHLHPLTIVTQDIVSIFDKMGFSVVYGPEIETEENNFDKLNIPPDHPARDMWDTFWLRSNQKDTRYKIQDTRYLLRTHTSPVQIRYMQSHKPPIRIIVPGKVFRYEATDATHEAQFYQVEGLMVDEITSLATLKGVLGKFLEEFFSAEGGKGIEWRLRPGYFPFVEPGVEVDLKYKGEWLEVLGAGMVHPNVLKNVDIDPEKYQGFAFGFGVDRLMMMKYNIPDIRLSYQGDLRLVNQF